ncbi:unnamed protein product [Periconia digitata]|uniref:Uncharacterized protein n=1 Tax=Periconia digitata TaxID=1303443 RepID=A0A9W4XMR2_9PLEO|nr:unnamed protein product [Periconia digitata]
MYLYNCSPLLLSTTLVWIIALPVVVQLKENYGRIMRKVGWGISNNKTPVEGEPAARTSSENLKNADPSTVSNPLPMKPLLLVVFAQAECPSLGIISSTWFSTKS